MSLCIWMLIRISITTLLGCAELGIDGYVHPYCVSLNCRLCFEMCFECINILWILDVCYNSSTYLLEFTESWYCV